MTTADNPRPPSGTRAEGRRLWNAILDEYQLDEHALGVLRQTVRAADACTQLQRIIDADGPMRDGKPNPALVELRQQRIILARLLIALRV